MDHIEASIQSPLTLSDLQRQSGYSTRQLQYLFQARFQCSPMQFVRRQRLRAALQALEEAAPTDTVTRIARRYGYRHAGHFAADFRRQHGVSPAEVLRAARGAGAGDQDDVQAGALRDGPAGGAEGP